jgi:3-oxoacyl-[acyl-carrier-protein] synthase-1
MSVRPLPITGFALCNALGATRDEVRDALYEGRSGLGPSPIEIPFETAVGAVHASLPTLPEPLAAWGTRTTRIAALLLGQLENELDAMRSRWPSHRIAIILGTSTAGADVTEQAYRLYLRDGALPADYDLFKHHTYGAMLHVVRELVGVRGPAWVISTACTSSAKPLASAQRLIESGVIDAAIVGGIDTLCGITLRGFHSLDALSSVRCRPFSAERTGLNIGEGGAFLLVEREAAPLALLEGVGESSDSYHVSAPHPEGLGAKLAMERALAQAGVTAATVDHVNAHGTGTKLNDDAESKAIVALCGRDVPVVSTKGYTGHMLGAAGGTEAVFAMMAILDGFIPASLGATPLDPKIEARVATERTAGTFSRVLSNSFAFGGNNVSVLIGAAR